MDREIPAHPPTTGESHPPLVAVGQADIGPVAAMLARAFHDDPFWRWMLPDGADYSTRLELAFAAQLRHLALPGGLVQCLPGFQGAALWSPPGSWHTSLASHLRYLPDLVRLCGAHRLPLRVIGIQRVQRYHPASPHYYLQVLAVDPRYQGQGLSRCLLAPVLAECDRQRLPAYLETANPENIPLYRHFGFRVCAELKLPAAGPPIWCLWRTGTSGQDYSAGG